jgi:hypothetical protein
MPVDEPRTAFDTASRRPSNPAEESGSLPPSGKRQIGGSRGEAVWLHPHRVREWFAKIDDRNLDIMMSRIYSLAHSENARDFDKTEPWSTSQPCEHNPGKIHDLGWSSPRGDSWMIYNALIRG